MSVRVDWERRRREKGGRDCAFVQDSMKQVAAGGEREKTLRPTGPTTRDNRKSTALPTIYATPQSECRHSNHSKYYNIREGGAVLLTGKKKRIPCSTPKMN